MNVPEMEDSRLLLLEMSFATVCNTCCHACLSLMVVVVVSMFDAFIINVYVFVYK